MQLASHWPKQRPNEGREREGAREREREEGRSNGEGGRLVEM